MPWVTSQVQALLNGVFRNTVIPINTTVYLGLIKNTPGNSNPPNLDGTYPPSASEVSTSDMSNYLRVAAAFSPATLRQISNPNAISFGTAAGVTTPFTITHGAIFSALTSGSMIAFGSLTSSLTVGNGVVINIPATQLIINDLGT